MTEGAPPPCSPKSICILAGLVGLFRSEKAFVRGVTLNLCSLQLKMGPLHDLAVKDIESKLSEENIVEEFFSRISARSG